MFEHLDIPVAAPKSRWSFSQWENYAGCPARWKYKSVLKLPSSPPGPAAARGLDMHDRAEQYILGRAGLAETITGEPGKRFGDKKPAIINQKYIGILDAYKEHPNGDRHTELKLAFDDEWYLTSHKNAGAACIAVLDAARFADGLLRIGEWKSGQPKDTHADQRHLYAMFGLRKWLAAEVEVTTYYLEDTAPPVRLKAKAENWPKMKEKWNVRIHTMRTDEICAPKPGMHCRWCDYAKAKGGPCIF